HRTPRATPFPYPTLFRSRQEAGKDGDLRLLLACQVLAPALAECLHRLAPRLDLAPEHGGDLVLGVLPAVALLGVIDRALGHAQRDRKSTRLNSSHVSISY